MKKSLLSCLCIICLALVSCATPQYNCSQYCAVNERKICRYDIGDNNNANFVCKTAITPEEKERLRLSTKEGIEVEDLTDKKNKSLWSWTAIGALITAIIVLIIAKDDDSSGDGNSSGGY